MKPLKHRAAGRPRLYPTPGYKMTVHVSDEVRTIIERLAEQSGICKHAVAREALLRGLHLYASNEQ